MIQVAEMEHSKDSKFMQFPDLAAADLRSLYRKFLGVMINPMWASHRTADAFFRLKALPIPSLCPDGFVFVWLPKIFLQSVWKILKSWGFVYVENLTWIQLQPNSKVIRNQDPANVILPSSHITLYIFRRGGKNIEIKHQRSSDVVFDFHSPDRFRVPREAYNAIETMLPTAYGKLLEIWSAADARRAGWMHLCEKPEDRPLSLNHEDSI